MGVPSHLILRPHFQGGYLTGERISEASYNLLTKAAQVTILFLITELCMYYG